MRKTKVVMITSYFDRNGVTSQVMNYATNLNKNKFQVSIAAGEPYDIGYEKACQENNIELCKLPQKQKNAYMYYKTIYSFLKKKKPDIVHVHGSSTLIAVELFTAMLAGVPVRISHSHNTTCSHPLLHKTLKPFLKVVSNCYLACGELAGKWMYGDGAFKVIPNAFETEAFALNSETRLSIRKKLEVGDNLVIGHIGKFNNQKNQNYLIRAFEKLSYEDDKAILLLVGNGPDLEEIRNQAQHTACADRIIFWGATENPEYLYSAMDVFALPSRFEGLPVIVNVTDVVLLLVAVFAMKSVLMIAVGALLTEIVSLGLFMKYVKKCIGYTYKEQVLDIGPSLLVAVSMGIIVYCVGLLKLKAGFLLIAQIVIGAIYYILVSYILHFEPFEYILKMVVEKFRK